MGTHPIFESDFDCLTEREFFVMPKSRRDKTYSLTQTKKQVGLEHKEKVVSQIQDFVNSYERIFIYSLENSRNNKLKDLRAEFKDDSRFYLGKNKLCQVAFGKSKELEVANGLHKFSKSLVGETGLLFTNKKEEEVVEYFNKYNSASYARVGEKSEVTVKVLAGPLPQFSFAIEGHLRERLKLPTALKDGVVTLMQDFFLAKDGEPITAQQSRLLKLFGCAITTFNVKLTKMWNKESGEVSDVNALTSWDKRTFNSIVVEGDDQRWAWLEDGQMKELMKKSKRVEAMDIEESDVGIGEMF